MDKSAFQKELDYGIALLLAREMLASGVIDPSDFRRIESLCAERFTPVLRCEKDVKLAQ
ncbi:MAG: hypothetical protein LBS11_07375 [Oscillospiraceae bacterium]|jgi:hypothetical protein|nr:hypothetical protein [Oscillospiraceae bacterium]